MGGVLLGERGRCPYRGICGEHGTYWTATFCLDNFNDCAFYLKRRGA